MNIRDELHEPPGDDLLAGEYALGVLDARQRRDAQARIETEPAFAQQVAQWETHLSGLFAQIMPVAVPAHLWPRVRTQLGWAPVASTPAGLWQSVRFWRGAAAAGAALAAALAVVAVLTPRPAPVPAPVVVAPTPTPPAPVPKQPKPVVVLARDDGSPGWLAALDAAHGEVTMTPLPAPVDPQGRVGELWLIPAGGAPQSLGFVSSERAHTVSVPAALRDALKTGALLAVTLEPEAGIPHAAPTGPIVAKGEIATI